MAATRIRFRRDTAENWAAINPVLLDGELGLVKGISKFKLGDGVTPWNLLDFSDPGTARYTYIRYSANSDGTDFSETPADYIGIVTTTDPTAPTDKTRYSWFNFKGEQGDASRVWIRYSANSDGTDFTTDPTGALYIGIAVDFNVSAPVLKTGYSWSRFRGVDGTDGVDGIDTLLIQYSPDGSTDWSSTYRPGTDYFIHMSLDAGSTWEPSLRIVGPQGAQGIQGVSIIFKGSYSNEAAFEAANPDVEQGWCYFDQELNLSRIYVGESLYVQMTASVTADISLPSIGADNKLWKDTFGYVRHGVVPQEMFQFFTNAQWQGMTTEQKNAVPFAFVEVE